MGIRQEVAFRNTSDVFKRLAEVANVATLTPEQRYHYEADVKYARDTLNQIRGAYQDGEEKGWQKGHQQGIEQGMEVERQRSIRMMRSFGISVSQVAELYGITEEEVLTIFETD